MDPCMFYLNAWRQSCPDTADAVSKLKNGQLKKLQWLFGKKVRKEFNFLPWKQVLIFMALGGRKSAMTVWVETPEEAG